MQPHPGVDQRLDRAKVGAVAGFHVEDADAVNEVGVDPAFSGVDRPTLGECRYRDNR